jgi:hypothetical protein
MKRLIRDIKNFIIRIERLIQRLNQFILFSNRWISGINWGTSEVPPLVNNTVKAKLTPFNLHNYFLAVLFCIYYLEYYSLQWCNVAWWLQLSAQPYFTPCGTTAGYWTPRLISNLVYFIRIKFHLHFLFIYTLRRQYTFVMKHHRLLKARLIYYSIYNHSLMQQSLRHNKRLLV